MVLKKKVSHKKISKLKFITKVLKIYFYKIAKTL